MGQGAAGDKSKWNSRCAAAGYGSPGGRTSDWQPTEREPIATSQPEIRAELDAQVAAWNRGDLKAYMQGYWHSPELTFFAGDKESAGWEAAYQRYHSVYQGKDREMGKLNFSNVRIEMLNGDAAFVRKLAAHDEGRKPPQRAVHDCAQEVQRGMANHPRPLVVTTEKTARRKQSCLLQSPASRVHFGRNP